MEWTKRKHPIKSKEFPTMQWRADNGFIIVEPDGEKEVQYRLYENGNVHKFDTLEEAKQNAETILS